MSDTTTKELVRKANAKADRQRAERKRNWALNSMIGIGAIIIVVFGFCTDRFEAWRFNSLFRHLGFSLEHHWKSWEFGALLWTLIFVLYYFLTVKFDVHKHRVWVRLSLIGLILSTLVAVYSLIRDLSFLHVFAITAVGATLMFTDGLLARGLRGKEKKEYRDSFWIAGVPTVTAYLVLVVYLSINTLEQQGLQKVEAPEIFISGAISFQLLISNIVFVILQKGWVRNPPKRKVKTTATAKTKPEVAA